MSRNHRSSLSNGSSGFVAVVFAVAASTCSVATSFRKTSRQFISALAPFSPTDAIKAEMTRLGGDKDHFQASVSSRYLNIAQTLRMVGGSAPWSGVPFSILIEGLHKIQPRYYSISSSALAQPERIAITAVVGALEVPGEVPRVVKGVTTNYLLALKQRQHGEPHPDPHGLTYAIDGPRNKYNGFHVPVHVRHSNFKLPSDPSRPIIMIGPGTGVAPFRAFVEERATQARAGQTVGKTMLFFGCRRRSEDFLYQSDWQVSHAARSPVRAGTSHVTDTCAGICAHDGTIL